jgi:cytochrome c551/c552
MKKAIFGSLCGLVFLISGCANNTAQVKPSDKSSSSITMNKKVKKAPKRIIRNRVYTKKKLKYKDTSESSKVRVYDPLEKKLVQSRRKSEKVPTSQGGKIFYDKGCMLCHKRVENRLGPSLKKLARGYKNKQKDLVLYLQRQGKAIIQPERGSIMKTQLVKLRILSLKEYRLLSQFILSAGKD